MIGREPERARLARAAASAAAGRATLVAVVGAYGLGKTTLLDAVRADGLARGATVLSTQGRAADAELGFASLLTLLRPVEADLDRLAGDLAPALRAALALGQRKASPVAIRVATFRVLSALAAERPLVVLVDDAHLLDRASADVLAFATGRFCADAVLTVVAAEQYVPTAFDELDAETIALDRLPDAAIAEIVTTAFPAEAAPLQRCVALADGNPLAGLELAASLDPAQRAGEVAMPTIPRLSGVIGSAFSRRLDRLSETACNALALAAADDTGELAVVTAALRRLGEPGDAIVEAEAAGLVTTDGGAVRFTHPLLRPVAYHQIGAASRRAAHAALAAVLDAPHQGASRAWQQVAAASGPDASVAGALALVAADIARRGGTASAARTLECAAALSPAEDQRRDHLVAATRAWLDAGEGHSAARVAATLATLPPTAASVAAAAEAFRGAQPAAQVMAFVTRALRASGTAGERAGCAAVLADEMAGAGALDDAVALAAPLADAPGPAGRLAAAVLACAGVRSPSSPVPSALPAQPGGGDPLDGRTLVLATEAAVDAGFPAPPLSPTGLVVAVGGVDLDLAVNRAVAAMHAGDVAGAHDQLLRLDAVVPDRAGILRARLDLALAEVELLLGRSADAAARAESVAIQAEEVGLGRLRARATWVLGRCALARGDDPTAAVHLRAACRSLPHLAGADHATAAGEADDDMRRWIGDPAPILDVRARRAAGELDTALARAEAAGLPLEAAAVVMAQAERARRSGDADTARDAADEASRRFAACGVTGWTDRLARLQQPATPSAPPLASVLSPAEHRVALAVAEGRTNQQAADTLYLSVKTVDFHLQNIYRKLGVRSRTQLAVVVHQRPVAVGVAS